MPERPKCRPLRHKQTAINIFFGTHKILPSLNQKKGDPLFKAFLRSHICHDDGCLLMYRAVGTKYMITKFKKGEILPFVSTHLTAQF